MTSISVGGVILCKQSISTFQYFKFVIGVIKREKIDIVHFHFGSYLIAPFLRILFPRIRIISTRHSEIFVSNKLKKLYLKFCFFPFERFLCVSCGVKKEMIEGVGFSSKSEVLYLGVRKKKIVNPNLKKTLDIPKGGSRVDYNRIQYSYQGIRYTCQKYSESDGLQQT